MRGTFMRRIDIKKQNTAIDTLSLNIVNLLKDLNTTDENLLFILGKIENYQQSLNAAIKRDKVYSGLDEADRARDEVLKRIDATLNGLVSLPVPEISSSAEKLLNVWKKYTLSIIAESYEKESSLIESFYADALNLTSDIKALPGFDLLLIDLRAKEDDFKEKSNAYLKNRASEIKTATAIKKELVTFMNSCFLPYLEAMQIIKPDAFKSLVSELEILINKTNG